MTTVVVPRASRRALGARAWSSPSAAATSWRACCWRATSSPRDGRRGGRGAPGRARPRGAGRARRRDPRHLRPALRRPGVRAGGGGRRSSRDPDELREALRRRPRGALRLRATRSAELELVTVRVAAALPGAEPAEPAHRGRGRGARHPRGALRRRGGWRRRCWAPGAPRSTGPAIVRAARARRWWCRRAGAPTAAATAVVMEASSELDPITLQVMVGALRAACDEMGVVLVRSAHSANIKERRDASTGLFDAEGQMVMQAEHIPVHLGAMPGAVAAVLGEEHAPGRRLDPQRPLPRRHPPARHHRDLAGLRGRRAGGVRRQPRPPRRRGRARARAACRPTRARSRTRAW